MATDDKRVIDILKAISTFDMEEDYNDTDARKQLSVMFRDLILSDNDILKEEIAELFQDIIMSDTDSSKQFISNFVDNVDTVIDDVEKTEMSSPEGEGDDVIMPDEEEPTEEEPAATEEEPAEESPEGEPAAGEEAGEGAEEEVPEDLFASRKYNSPLVEYANTFMWS